jgi:hypothetical protein
MQCALHACHPWAGSVDEICALLKELSQEVRLLAANLHGVLVVFAHLGKEEPVRQTWLDGLLADSAFDTFGESVY